jgi:hypothetical protein
MCVHLSTESCELLAKDVEAEKSLLCARGKKVAFGGQRPRLSYKIFPTM